MNAVDTNVLIYACDARDSRFQQTALELLDSLAGGVLLWQVACEFIAASRKRETAGFTRRDAWENLRDFMTAFTLVVPNSQVLEGAKVLQVDHQCSFWDAMIYAACREAGVTRIHSEDLPGAPVEDLEIINPFAGLA